MDVRDRDIEYLRQALLVAQCESTDPSTQNGAILVRDGVILASAANHFPIGVSENIERWTRPLKYQFVEHAERNVIFRAAAAGIRTSDATMYCPWFSCAECARAIIQAGIKEVVGLNPPADSDCAATARWKESIRIGDTMLNEARVIIRRINAYFGLVLLRDGKQIIF